jgi:hypothetical protein
MAAKGGGDIRSVDGDGQPWVQGEVQARLHRARILAEHRAIVHTTRPVPAGWPRMSSSLAYQDPVCAIDWLVAGERSHPPLLARSPKSLDGANSQALFIYVNDIEAHYTQALAAGAVVARELATTDYGADYWTDRGYAVLDPEGHTWHFAQRLRP